MKAKGEECVKEANASNCAALQRGPRSKKNIAKVLENQDKMARNLMNMLFVSAKRKNRQLTKQVTNKKDKKERRKKQAS